MAKQSFSKDPADDQDKKLCRMNSIRRVGTYSVDPSTSKFRNPSLKRFIILAVLVVVFHFAGGFLIMYVDGHHSRQIIETYTNRCQSEYEKIINLINLTFSSKLTETLTEDAENVRWTEIQSFVQTLDTCHRNAVQPKSLLSTDDFYNSALLAFTIYTTIGYGTVSASSLEGQIVCTLYAFFICPLFFALIGESVLSADYVSMKLITWYSDKEHSWKPYDYRLGFTRYCSVPLAASFIFTLLNILIGSLILIHWKDWSIWESIYFIFQSICLIGFGDYFEVDQTPWVFLIPWLTLGIALYMICVIKMQIVWQMLSYQIQSLNEKCRKFSCSSDKNVIHH